MTNHARVIHMMLHPEKYPQAEQPDHPFWTGAADVDDITGVYQWDADTLDWIAEYVESHLTARVQ